MPNNFNEITCVKSLQEECEGLLAQVQLHQRQIAMLREQLAEVPYKALQEAYEALFFFHDTSTGDRIPIGVGVDLDAFYAYMQEVKNG